MILPSSQGPVLLNPASVTEAGPVYESTSSTAPTVSVFFDIWKPNGMQS